MIEEIRLAFAAIQASESTEESTLRLVRVTADVEAWVGEDREYRPHFVLPVNPGESFAASLEAVTITLTERIVERRQRRVVDVVCTVPALTEVFQHFVGAVLTRLREQPCTASEALGAVLETWRRFLYVGRSNLGTEKVAAVFGELIVLAELAAIDASTALDTWSGAERARHDFRGGPAAVEVKTSTSATSRAITVHGEEQLLAPGGGTLHLHFIRLESVAGGGRPLRHFIEAILDCGADPGRLFGLLEQAGIVIGQLGTTDNITFEIRERFTLPIDDGVPRIIPDSFRDGKTPPGVQALTYRVDLDPHRHRAIDPHVWEAVLANLIAGGSA